MQGLNMSSGATRQRVAARRAQQSAVARRVLVHVQGCRSVRCCASTEKEPAKFPVTQAIFSGSKYVSLHRAEKSIKEYCERVDGEDRAECFTALEKLEKQHNELASQGEGAAEALDRLDQLARELSAIGNTRIMVQALAHLQHKLEQAKAREAGTLQAPEPSDSESEMSDQGRQRLREVYDRMDRNKDGYLNIAEFREAMDELGDHLDGRTVAEICEALDVHGKMDFDQFADAVEVHCLQEQTPEAKMLRGVLHHHSDKQFNSWLKTLS